MNAPRHHTPHKREQWVQRFYNPTVLWVHPAQNVPHRALLVSNTSGKFQLHAHDFVSGFSRQLTRKSQGALLGSISPDGRFVFFLDDRRGDEHGHFMRISFAGGRKVDITPSLPPYYSYEVSVGDQGDVLCFSASIGDTNKVYLVPFAPNGKPRTPHLLYESSRFIQGTIMSPDGSLTCIAVLCESSTTVSEVLIFNNTTGKVVYEFTGIKGSFIPHAFSRHASEPLLLGLANTGGSYRPVLLYPAKKTIKEVQGGMFKGDVFAMGWIEHEQKLLLCDVYKARHRLFLYDLGKRNAKRIGPMTGSFDLFFNSVATLPDNSLLVRWHSFGVPPRILKLRAPTYRKTTELYAPMPAPKLKSTFESVEFRSSDDTPVQMWVARPHASNNARPFVMAIHGGPHGVVGDEFSPEAQAWLDRGFGYCAVNYRGSIGFGKEFEEGIYGNPGTWEVEDVVAARNWLVKKGLADPERIILSGWSWGGYVALLALGKYPNAWAGGIAGTPIADCVPQYEDEPAFFRATDRKLFGGTPAQVPETYARSSPITYIKHIQAPILILHGESDVRCPPRQIVHFERALKAEGKPITVRRFLSGHAGEFANTKIRVSNVKAALDFANGLKVRELV